ncbi:MAG: hypothetical protein ACLTMW_02725 [Blautia hydrogenotrophica]
MGETPREVISSESGQFLKETSSEIEQVTGRLGDRSALRWHSPASWQNRELAADKIGGQTDFLHFLMDMAFEISHIG